MELVFSREAPFVYADTLSHIHTRQTFPPPPFDIPFHHEREQGCVLHCVWPLLDSLRSCGARLARWLPHTTIHPNTPPPAFILTAGWHTAWLDLMHSASHARSQPHRTHTHTHLADVRCPRLRRCALSIQLCRCLALLLLPRALHCPPYMLLCVHPCSITTAVIVFGATGTVGRSLLDFIVNQNVMGNDIKVRRGVRLREGGEWEGGGVYINAHTHKCTSLQQKTVGCSFNSPHRLGRIMSVRVCVHVVCRSRPLAGCCHWH